MQLVQRQVHSGPSRSRSSCVKPWLSPQHREGDGERKSDPVLRNSIEEKKHRGIPHCILFQKGREIYKKVLANIFKFDLKKKSFYVT